MRRQHRFGPARNGLYDALRTPMLVALALAIGFGGAILSTLYILNATIGFGAVDVGPWRAFPTRASASADFYAKAHRAREGILLYGEAEGLVFIAGRDSGGQPLTGNCTYAVSGLTPPARFWTLVALGKDAQTLKPATGIPGAINALNVLRAEDGRFSITVSALAATGNWLAIENEGPFRLRLTLIDTPVSSSSGISALEMPVITRTDCRHA